MTILGLKRKIVFCMLNKILAGTKHFEAKRRLLNYVGFEIEDGTKIVGPMCCDANLKIGKNCWIGKNFTVNGNGNVIIGDNCDIAPEVAFQTGGHEISNGERRAGKGIRFDIVIGNGCWIGARSTILGGVIVEEYSIIAACACVCEKVSKNTLVGGVPARIIKMLEKEEEVSCKTNVQK